MGDLSLVSELSAVVKLLGGGALSFLLLRQVMELMKEWRLGQRDAIAAAAPATTSGNGQSGLQGVNFWVEKIRAIVKVLLEDLILPALLRLINLLEVVSARLISMDMEHRAMYESQMKEHAESIRQLREIAEMVRARHERDARARAGMEIGLANYSRDIADLRKMVQELLDHA